MSLYGIKVKDENQVDFFEKNLTDLRKRNLEVSKILFSLVAIVVAYNIYQSFGFFIHMIGYFFTFRDFNHYNLAFLFHSFGVVVVCLLLLASCFTRNKKMLVPSLIFSIVQIVGWLTANIEMTQYQYVENNLVLRRPDFIDYLPTLTMIPYQVRDYLLKDVSMEMVRMYNCSVEVLQIIFLSYLYKFGNKNNNI